MPSLLDSAASILVIGFALIMMFDFISGLVRLYCASAPSVDGQLKQALAPQTEPDSQQQVIPGWDLIEPVGSYAATLSSIEQNLPPAEMWVTEIPDASPSWQASGAGIALCKSRQPQVQPVVTLATHQQLVSAGIRKCKKLASSLHVRRYNTMRLAELADVLAGKVTASELAA